jgi:hypothetical protein
MDVYDPDFFDSISIDEPVKKVTKHFNDPILAPIDQ